MSKRRKRTSQNLPAKGRLRDMADSLWSLAVRADWGGRCAVCGCRKCEAHHLIPRQHQSTRYDLRNGISLCCSHHKFDKDLSPHLNAAGWLLWLSEMLPACHCWYTETVKQGGYRQFDGMTTALYYCDVIRRLKEYVADDDFARVVGQRFATYLERETDDGS